MSNFNPQSYWEARLTKNFNVTGVGYLPLGRGFNFWMYEVRKYVFRRAIRKLTLNLPESAALDIGSGTGFYIDLMTRLGLGSITGVDITEAATQRLKQKFPAHSFYQTDISEPNLPFEAGAYDLISCFDVLFHIVDDNRYQQALTNVHKLLKADGYFVFTDNLTREDQVAEHHISRSLETVKAAIADAGFKIQSVDPSFVLLNSPVASHNPLLKLYWKVLHTGLNAFKRIGLGAIGYVVGALLFPLEMLLLSTVGYGPSTKILVCTKA
ncbi:MAG: class I SAM-dependent methyltransferase [Bacteroidota bacterium]